MTDLTRQQPVSSALATAFKEKLLVGPQARQEFLALLDLSFPVPRDAHFFDDFPVWDERNAPVSQQVLRVGLYENDRLVACAGARIAEMSAPKGKFPVAVIGAVATHPDYRGKGLATQIVAATLRRAAQAGAYAVFLWGSEHELYRKLGFELCGMQGRIALKNLTLQRAAATEIGRGWTVGIGRMLQAREGGLTVYGSDLRWIQAHKNVQWFWAGTPEAPRAFAAIGRGIDLQGHIHEWGGEKPELEKVLAAIRELEPEAAILGSPKHFERQGWNVREDSCEFLCLARIIEPVKLFELYHAPGALKIGRHPNGWAVELEGSGPFQVSSGELTQIFYGLASRGMQPWSKYFPLPLWLWGLDGA